jgi:hypothetical protein
LTNAGSKAVATTVTDASGHYRFDQLNGVGGIGDYAVSLVVPPRFVQTSQAPSPISLRRGHIQATGVGFGLAPGQDGPQGPSRGPGDVLAAGG